MSIKASNRVFLTRIGGVIAVAGVAAFVAFTIVLLSFPVVQKCNQVDGQNCRFVSTAPNSLQQLVKPGFLAISLSLIAGGVFVVRFTSWREAKKTGS